MMLIMMMKMMATMAMMAMLMMMVAMVMVMVLCTCKPAGRMSHCCNSWWRSTSYGALSVKRKPLYCKINQRVHKSAQV